MQLVINNEPLFHWQFFLLAQTILQASTHIYLEFTYDYIFFKDAGQMNMCVFSGSDNHSQIILPKPVKILHFH